MTPETALHKAKSWLAGTVRDSELRVLARHIACVASVERGRMPDARYHARLGLAAARRAALPHREAQLRLTLAWVELDRGAIDASRAHLDASEPQLSDADVFRAGCLRGLLHCQSDRYPEAVVELTTALQHLHGIGDRHWMANALLGRGLSHFYMNQLDEAESDLFAAERVFAEDGWVARAAACRHNRGCVAFRSGDLTRALRLFQDARSMGLDADSNPEVLVDRAEALDAAGLCKEARAEMWRAATKLETRGRAVRLAETRLALAGCALRDGDLTAAIEAALEARRLFRGQHRPAWAALAAATVWRAKLRAGHRSRYAFAAARRAATVCASYGWTAAAAELWLTAGRVAQRSGMHRTARKLLELAARSKEEPSATAPQRVVGWVGAAWLAEQAGDRRKVFEACRNGLRTIEDYAAAIAAFELRVQAFGLAGDLTETAMAAALQTGDPSLILHWTERSRASALNRRALQPPSDPDLRAALVRLRAAAADMRDSQGRPPRERLEQVAELEHGVRHRAILVDGEAGSVQAPCDIADVRSELDSSVLVSLFVHEGHIYAISIVDGDIRLSALDRESAAVAMGERLRHFLTRQAQGGPARLETVFADGAREAAEYLERNLLAPVLPELTPGRPLVVVPTGGLHTVPWAELPSCQGRSVTVAPSLRCWLRAAADARRQHSGNEEVWVAGPGLEHGEREVHALHEVSGGHLLVGAEATAEQVMTTLDGARTAHIAAHGHFRDDQPLLSCLDLSDGPLYGYDLDRLHQGPTTVVLSACEVGRSAVSRGDELIGLTAALLGRGTATVIASVVPVPDERTAEVMVSLHDLLRRSVPPAEALARAQAQHGESGFICLGYGGR